MNFHMHGTNRVSCTRHTTTHRMTKIIFLIVLVSLTINCNVANAIALQCRFEMMRTDVGEFYACTATLLIETRSMEEITSIYGAHQTGKGNEDVNLLQILSQNMEFFPTNIDEFFPNIVAIEFGNNSISSVSNGHLIKFPNLWYLGLAHNRISELDNNLFSGLNSLQFIQLAVNRITSIDSNLFAGLSAGSSIDLSNNTIRHVGHDLILPENFVIQLRNNICVNTMAHTGLDNVEEFKFNLLMQCPPSISLIESTLASRSNFIQDLINRVKSLEAIIENNGIKIKD